MANDTIFYIFGSVLAALAVATSFIGLRSEKFPGRFAPFVVVVFLALIGATTTFAVLNGKDEEKARAAEIDKANEEAEAQEEGSGQAESPQAESAEGGGQKAPASGPGGTLQLAASPTDLAFDKTELSSEPGE